MNATYEFVNYKSCFSSALSSTSSLTSKGSSLDEVADACGDKWSCCLIGNIAISSLVAAVVLYGASSIEGLDAVLCWYVAGVVFFVNLAREIIKDCQDMEADSDSRQTLPMKIGKENLDDRKKKEFFIKENVSKNDRQFLTNLYKSHWFLSYY